MFKHWVRLSTAAALSLSALTITPSSASTGSASAGPAMVLMEAVLAANATPEEALAPVNDVRPMMKRQPGFLSDEFLQKLHASQVPGYVHLSRWTSMSFWAALSRRPEMSRLSARGNVPYTLSARAFVPAG